MCSPYILYNNLYVFGIHTDLFFSAILITYDAYVRFILSHEHFAHCPHEHVCGVSHLARAGRYRIAGLGVVARGTDGEKHLVHRIADREFRGDPAGYFPSADAGRVRACYADAAQNSSKAGGISSEVCSKEEVVRRMTLALLQITVLRSIK